jgi:hypothetical protein
MERSSANGIESEQKEKKEIGYEQRISEEKQVQWSRGLNRKTDFKYWRQ